MRSQAFFVLILLSFLLSASSQEPRLGPLDCTGPFGDCTGDICAAQRIESTRTMYYCIVKSHNPHWTELCDGLQDSDASVTQCCLENGCNVKLTPRLPSESNEGPTGYPPYRPSGVEPMDVTTEVTTGDRITTEVTTEDSLLDCTFKMTGVEIDGHPGYCRSSTCLTVRFIRDGSIATTLRCVLPHEDAEDKCSGQLNTNTVAYECCNSGDRCNDDLFPLLPGELTSTTTSATTLADIITTATTPVVPSGNLDVFNILTIVIVILALVIISIVILVVVLVCCYRHRRQAKVIGEFTTTPTSTVSDISTSTESVPSKQCPEIMRTTDLSNEV